MHARGGSRISHCGGANPHWRGASLRHKHFLVKTYVKTKEFGPVGGGGVHWKLLYVDPPLHANKLCNMSMSINQRVAGYHVYQIYTMCVSVRQHFFETQESAHFLFIHVIIP